MRAAQIHGGIVVNVINVPGLNFLPDLVDAETGGNIGDAYDYGAFAPPVSPVDFQAQKLQYFTEVRKMRAEIFARLNGYGVELMLGEPPVFVDERALLSVIFNGLRDITTIAPVVAATDIASLRIAVKAEYARLVGLSSPGMKTAFAGADK